MKPFPKELPESSPSREEFPEEYEQWRVVKMGYDREKEAWDIAESLQLLRKWVFWCADFCDLNQDFTLKYRYQQ